MTGTILGIKSVNSESAVENWCSAKAGFKDLYHLFIFVIYCFSEGLNNQYSVRSWEDAKTRTHTIINQPLNGCVGVSGRIIARIVVDLA